MEVESLTPEKENTIRNKFHRRGLSSKSKSSSSDDSLSSPLSSKDPLANLKQFIPRREILSELYTLNSSQRECRSDEQLLSESIVEKKCPPGMRFNLIAFNLKNTHFQKCLLRKIVFGGWGFCVRVLVVLVSFFGFQNSYIQSLTESFFHSCIHVT